MSSWPGLVWWRWREIVRDRAAAALAGGKSVTKALKGIIKINVN